jgi:hypothetical protein
VAIGGRLHCQVFAEHPYAWIKGRLNNHQTRYRGLARNFCRSFALKPA